MNAKKTYTKEELALIIEKHGKWLRDEEGGERANLSSASLRSANLSSANLSYANGNAAQIKTIYLETYPIAYTAEYLQIGCERHAIADWWVFDDERITRMDGTNARRFWDKWKPVLRQIIEISPATPTGHEGQKQEAA